MRLKLAFMVIGVVFAEFIVALRVVNKIAYIYGETDLELRQSEGGVWSQFHDCIHIPDICQFDARLFLQ